MSASLEEFVELLSSEQHVDISRLRHLARHGIHPAVRGEVWMYLLGVLSADKSQEMTSVRALYNAYDALLSHCQVEPEVRASIEVQANRVWRGRVTPLEARDGDAGQKGSKAMPRTREGAVVYSQEPTIMARKKRSQLVPVAPMNLEPVGLAASSSSSSYPGSSTRSQPPSPGPSSSSSSSTTSSSSSAPQPPPLSAAEREHEEQRIAFVRRVTNIVGVYIAKQAHDKCEARKLRKRLAQEQRRRAQQQQQGAVAQSPGSDSDKSDMTHRGAHELPTSPLPQVNVAHVGHDDGSAYTESPRRSFSRSSSGGSSSQGSGQAHEANIRMPENVIVDEDEEGIQGSPEEPLFDPAMGMGVDDSPLDEEYPDELASSSNGGPGFSSRSRGSSKKGTPRMGGGAQPSDDGSDGGKRHRSHSSRRRRRIGHSRHSSSGSEDGSGSSSQWSADEGQGVHGRARSSNKHNGLGLGLDDSTLLRTPIAGRTTRSGSRTPHQVQPTPSFPQTGGQKRPHQVRSGYSSPLRSNQRSGWQDRSPPMPLSPGVSQSRSRTTSRFRRHHRSRTSGSRSSPSSPRPQSSDEADSDDDSGSGSGSSSSSSSAALDEHEAELQRRLFSPHLIHLCSPLALVSLTKRVEAGVYFAFHRLVHLVSLSPAEHAHQLSVFHSLFRRTLPDLKAYFEEEGVDVTPFVGKWLKGLLAGEGMRLDREGSGGVVRLWDAYFARVRKSDWEPLDGKGKGRSEGNVENDKTSHTRGNGEDKQQLSSSTAETHHSANDEPHARSEREDKHHPHHSAHSSSTDREPLSLHLYVCLSVLQHCKDTLEELDGSECESLLRNLPSHGLEVDKILSEAVNLRLGHRLAVEAAANSAGTGGRAALEKGARDDDEEAEDDDMPKPWSLQPLFFAADDGTFDDFASSSEEDEGTDDAITESTMVSSSSVEANDPSSSARDTASLAEPVKMRNVATNGTAAPLPLDPRREALLSSLPGEGDLDPLLARHLWSASIARKREAAERERAKSKGRSKSKSTSKSGRAAGSARDRGSSSSSGERSGSEIEEEDEDDYYSGEERYRDSPSEEAEDAEEYDEEYEEDDDDDVPSPSTQLSSLPHRPAFVSSRTGSVDDIHAYTRAAGEGEEGGKDK
ncbi:hypothetical protein BDZ90DRAFT_141248 [Jaminaea rosea]|uniref:Rab-GAP TBC domain-containing protein n=1 Tax=Jaminaea rosea TaxID=1569628 RepID=A0A316UY28_9BASI|nr:hypothetical protein BDZ90DRAFT_141248 [Jaminaea rosea]PWN29211.1 hypothetical protein BDZ90DRAFT_141248 [Jaminaea rosea]